MPLKKGDVIITGSRVLAPTDAANELVGALGEHGSVHVTLSRPEP